MTTRTESDCALVTTDWVAEHLTDPHVVLVEVSRDPSLYSAGHIAGAVNWSGDPAIASPIRRPNRFRSAMERLLADSGIDNYATIVLYGDSRCFRAARALWCLALCGHDEIRLLDGGRDQWLREARPLSLSAPQRVPVTYKSVASDTHRAAARDRVRHAGLHVVVDADVTATIASGAVHIPWSSTLNGDGTFKPASALESLFAARGVTRAHHIVTASVDGAASAHAWFALSRVLRFPHVRNCEGA